MTFKERKRQLLEKLKIAKKENKVDLEVLDIIDLINFSNNYYTSSSCSGRIILIEVLRPSHKKDAKFILKLHREVKFKEIKGAIKKHQDNQLWLMSEPPILHIGAKDLYYTKEMLNLGYRSGFKRSNIKSVGTKFIVEIMSSEEIHVPIAYEGKLLVEDKYLEYVVDISNNILKRGKDRLKKLYRNLKEEIKTD